MQLCLPMGIERIVVKTDCLVAIQALEAGSKLYASYHHLIHEKLFIKASFQACKFAFVEEGMWWLIC